MTGEFKNHPLLELRRPEVRSELAAALASLDAELPLSVRMTGGEEGGGAEAVSVDPCATEREVARLRWASPDQASRALGLALEARWPRRPLAERAAVLERAAELIAERRHRLAALIVREVGKPWEDADAEVCEAIDFLRFYARTALEQETESLVQVPGERNEVRLRPRGPAAVISPWNFPLSIPCGMASAALVMGNPVLFKPAEQSPACGFALTQTLLDARVEPAALALLPGDAQIGRWLVAEPRIATIAFTGSVAVGLEIHRRAHERPEQVHIRRVVAELGGKNCVIVDSDVDLDEAIPAIVRSAYGYAGQKCSAAARALIHEGVADRLIERLAGGVEILKVGPAEDFATEVPALIDPDAVAKYAHYAELCRGAELARAEAPPAPQYVDPLLADADRLPSESPVLHEEVFGPLLTVERVRDLDEAAERVSELPQALTAGILSRHPERVEHLIARIPAGVVYVDRAITGAMVGRQPFGGNRLSGIGAKAGGPDYLKQFTEPRVLTENTMRHGLIVD
jgi:RHH-type proline utilization regulon transcriptional repressor/proline dehydrogenase/delta 1-pyrroline-5-carboxylate dehydrogenase